jgi:hypothetical protein
MQLVIAGLLAAALATPQQDTAPPAVPTERTLDAEDTNLLRSVRRIADRLAQARGETFDRKPEAIRSPDAMASIVAEARAYRAIGPERLAARGRAWNDIGFGGPASPVLLWLTLAQDLPGIDLDSMNSRLLVSPGVLTGDDYGVEVGEAFFVPDGEGGVHEFHPDREDDSVVPNNPDGQPAGDFLLATGVRPDEPLLAHYLMHLRQLERGGQDSIRETTDGLLAASAWAEGEANLVSLYFLFQGVGAVRTVLTGPVGPGDFLGGRLIPDAVDQATPLDAALLTFVYEDGYDFAIRRWRAAGWSVFERKPPATTRELLHPEKPVVGLGWPEPVAPGPDFELRDTDRLGQYAVISLVSIWTGQTGLAMTAARGWAGDRLTRWERSPDDGVTVWETRWETAVNAQEFAAAYTQAVQRRDPSAKAAETSEASKAVLLSRFRRIAIAVEGLEVRIEIEPSP